ncbi:hypothetical protein GCM10022247_72650 [Allokutzneria multivorans]|uniref:OmpA-like domain-containing protein n=1 Tax=Allokutzneria multivorans TaxID=1142134 RepID=A0ABP7U5Q0_9PSEU
MMQLGTQFEVDGVQVFADHADPAQFWYLATQVRLGRGTDGGPAFSMIKYRPAVAEGGVRGGGFLMFQSEVVLPPATRSRIMARLAAKVPSGTPKLAPAQVDSGSVRCLALNLEGSGGTTAPPGAFAPVTRVLGATKPSMLGAQTAAFSLALDQEGATILQQAFEKAATPIGVIYDFEYSALTPEMRIEITADFERIYTHFSAGVEAQLYWVRAGIEAGFEKLVQDGAISVKVTDFTGATNQAEREKWALDFFKDVLLKQWFEPSLDLGQLKGPAQPEGLDDILKRLKELKKPAAPAMMAAAEQPKATLVITSPDPMPEGYGLSLGTADGNKETLVVKGPPGAVVTVDGKPQTVDGDGKVVVDVAPGSTHPVTVDWPASAPVDETFKLFFTYDQPKEPGFSPTPGNPVYNSYLLGNPTPPDPRFSQSTAPGKESPTGADALRDWLENRLAEPKKVAITAHASFEGDTSPAKADFNLKLSRRRLAVVKGIIANRATVTSGEGLGFSRAQAAGRNGDQDDRVAEITGKVAGEHPAVAIRATLARAAAQTDPPPTDPPPTDPPPTDPPPTTPPADSGPHALVSFKLKFLRQEERKTLKFVYDRRMVVKRGYAPQGFIGLLLDEIPDKGKYFVLVDLADPFFEKLAVDIATPADFADLGLFSTDVAIGYGDRRQEFRLTAAEHGPRRFETFLNASYDLDFSVGVQHHFDANSGWIGERLSYDVPARRSVDRTLKVDPADDLGFLRLEVFPNRVDAGIVTAIDVELSYDDGANFRQTNTFRVLPDSAKQLWKLRLSKSDKRTWSASFTHHLKNGGTRRTGPITGTAPYLPVDDPFTDSLDIVAVPLFPAGTVRQAFLDVTYEDPGNAYRRVERIELAGDAVEPVPLRIALLDGSRRVFRHRITIIGTDGSLTQRAPVDGEETLIGVR